jgi:hypothetical protein
MDQLSQYAPTQQPPDETLIHQEPEILLPRTHTPFHHLPAVTPPPPYGAFTPSRAPCVALADSPTLPSSDNIFNHSIGVPEPGNRSSSNNTRLNLAYNQNSQPQPNTPTTRIPPARESSSLLPPASPSNPLGQVWGNEVTTGSASSSFRETRPEHRELSATTHGSLRTHQRQLSDQSSLMPRISPSKSVSSRSIDFQLRLGTVGRPASTESLLMNPPETPINMD